MRQHDKEIAKHVAEKNMKIVLANDQAGHIQLQLFGQQWTFETETDAEVVERVTEIFQTLTLSMAEIVNESLQSWIVKNRSNFN